MSTSDAPFTIASLVSMALVTEVFAPNGNPMTVHTFTGVPSRRLEAKLAFAGFTHTEAKPYSFASSQSLAICSRVASGLSSVWSIKPASSWEE